MKIIKIVLSIIYLILGFYTGYNTYKEFKHPESVEATYSSNGIDSSKDGAAVGMGLISGFCVLSSTLLILSISDKPLTKANKSE